MMTKADILSITLDQLIGRFETNPESFDYVGCDLEKKSSLKFDNDSVIWQTKIESNSEIIVDPTSQQRTIVVNYSIIEKALKVYIYNCTFESVGSIYQVKADACIEHKAYFIRFTRNFRKFNKLKNLILAREEHNEARSFLKKLSSTFPDTLDNHIFGK